MVFAVPSEMCQRMWRSARMWKLHDLQTCSLNDSVSSIVTPKLWTLLTRLTQPRSTVLTKHSIRFRALVLITMASVISGFTDKSLRSSQCWTAQKHSDSIDVELSSLMSHSMACFLVLEEFRELNKCDRFVICGVFTLCVDQVDS